MLPRILLVNPPIYDFTAYDYWLKPYGLLRVAGHLRHQAELHLFDHLDRCHPAMATDVSLRTDRWGRGSFSRQAVSTPSPLAAVPRTYYRFGLDRQLLQDYLVQHGPFDAVLIQTVMTYWYPGVKEVIDTIRAHHAPTPIALGGVYATLCPDHARSLGADLIVEGLELAPLWNFLGTKAEPEQLPYWEGYSRLETGVIKLTEGCPFRCTYCSVPQVYPKFSGYLDRALAEYDYLLQRDVTQVAFYDDALLFKEKQLFIPFLNQLIDRGAPLQLHTPNALNARFISADLAQKMVEAGFKSFYLGFESNAYAWQKKTGGKVYSAEFAQAITHLQDAGVDPAAITAYLIVAHPNGQLQAVEDSMYFAHQLGIRLMLSEFSPIPGTPDGEACRALIDLDEPLWHNKSAFPFKLLGKEKIQQLKSLCKQLNNQLRLVPDINL